MDGWTLRCQYFHLNTLILHPNHYPGLSRPPPVEVLSRSLDSAGFLQNACFDRVSGFPFSADYVV
jgi:hypothetical protein